MTEISNSQAQDLSLGTDDVIGFLLGQHQQVKILLDEVTEGSGESRQQSFDQLREMLARHETAEEMILRPLTKKVPGGEAIADGRFAEENESKEVLARLEKMEIDSVEFTATFAEFRTAVLEHAQNEERLEFPALRANLDEDALRKAKDRLAGPRRWPRPTRTRPPRTTR